MRSTRHIASKIGEEVSALLTNSSLFMVFSGYTATTVNASSGSASINQAVEGISPMKIFWGAQNWRTGGLYPFAALCLASQSHSRGGQSVRQLGRTP